MGVGAIMFGGLAVGIAVLLGAIARVCWQDGDRGVAVTTLLLAVCVLGFYVTMVLLVEAL